MSEHLVATLDDLEPASPHRVDVGGRSIALVRLGDDVYAIGDRCSHANVSLSDGEVDEGDCTLECPKHGSTFDLRTGEPGALPATRPVPTYAVEVRGAEVFLTVEDADSGVVETEVSR
jgi:3-phenylpropionate/trans-cinnamate dioxygenase ferredoxin subunit